MRGNTKAVIPLILLLITIAISSSGYAGSLPRKTYNRNAPPFDTDRVATVHIMMKEKDWKFCQTDAFKEQYVPADFWFDGEKIPNVGVRPKGNSSLGQAVGWRRCPWWTNVSACTTNTGAAPISTGPLSPMN
jgi:spore coat protein CotH